MARSSAAFQPRLGAFHVCRDWSRHLLTSIQILAEADGALSHNEAIALGSQNIEKLLGLDINDQDREMVAYAGGDIFSFESKAVAVIQPLRARVDLL